MEIGEKHVGEVLCPVSFWGVTRREGGGADCSMFYRWRHLPRPFHLKGVDGCGNRGGLGVFPASCPGKSTSPPLSVPFSGAVRSPPPRYGDPFRRPTSPFEIWWGGGNLSEPPQPLPITQPPFSQGQNGSEGGRSKDEIWVAGVWGGVGARGGSGGATEPFFCWEGVGVGALLMFVGVCVCVVLDR